MANKQQTLGAQEAAGENRSQAETGCCQESCWSQKRSTWSIVFLLFGTKLYFFRIWRAMLQMQSVRYQTRDDLFCWCVSCSGHRGDDCPQPQAGSAVNKLPTSAGISLAPLPDVHSWVGIFGFNLVGNSCFFFAFLCTNYYYVFHPPIVSSFLVLYFLSIHWLLDLLWTFFWLWQVDSQSCQRLLPFSSLLALNCVFSFVNTSTFLHLLRFARYHVTRSVVFIAICFADDPRCNSKLFGSFISSLTLICCCFLNFSFFSRCFSCSIPLWDFFS